MSKVRKYTKEFIDNLGIGEVSTLLKKSKVFEKDYQNYLQETYPKLPEYGRAFLKGLELLNEPIINLLAIWQSTVNNSANNLYNSLKSTKSQFINNEILYSKGWILSPYLLREEFKDAFNLFKLNQIDSKLKVDKCFYDFFIKDNFIQIEEMIFSWKHNKFFKKRTKSLLDLVTVLRLLDANKSNINININKLILPFLITQIDGIIYDYLKSTGHTFDGTRVVKDKRYVGKFYWIKWKATIRDHYISDFIQNVLYGKSFPKEIKEKGSSTFSRNKILHGDNLKFGTKKNLIRAYLVLDFLSEITKTEKNNL